MDSDETEPFGCVSYQQPAQVRRARDALGILGGAARQVLGNAAAEPVAPETRQAGRALTEALLHALSKSSPNLFYATDRHGRLLYANPAMLAVIGRPATEVLGRTVAQWHVDPTEAQAVMVSDQRVLEAGTTVVVDETFTDARDGEVHVFESTKTPLREPGMAEVIGLVGVSRDVTAERRARAALADAQVALREQAEALRLFVERAPAAIAMVDDAMRYIAVSRRFVEAHQLDVEPEAMFGRSHYELFGVIPERWWEAHHRVLAGETASADDDPFPRADGGTDRARWEMVPWHRPNGEVGGALLFSEVITARVDAERTLAASNERLAIASRTEALSRLAGHIGQDFNNILHVVRNGVETAAKRLASDPRGALQCLDLVCKAADHGALANGRLLTFARKDKFKAEPIAPQPLLEGLAQRLRGKLGAKFALSVAVAPSLPALVSDRSLLEAVLTNLVDNACDAMPDGGSLVLAAEALYAHDMAEAAPGLPEADYVRLAVIDQGVGMLPEVLAGVVEPFFTTKIDRNGIGYGLTIARGFAERSGGGLTIESAPGTGTRVMLWLPQAQLGGATADKSQPEAITVSPPQGLRDKRILLVDDRREIRTAAAAELAEGGHLVTEVDDPSAALALIDRGLQPDALITHLTVPGGLDGLDLILTARARLPSLPALLVASQPLGAVSGKMMIAARSGPFAVVRKPASVDALVGHLETMLHAPDRCDSVTDSLYRNQMRTAASLTRAR